MKGQISVYKACTKDFVESKDVDEWQNTRRTHRLEIVDRLGTSSYTCLPLAILLISVGNSTLHRKDLLMYSALGSMRKPSLDLLLAFTFISPELLS